MARLLNINGTLFFSAFHPDTGSELWKSDGTAAGTVLVKDIRPGPASSGPTRLVDLNGILLFTAFGAENGGGWTGDTLWKSDGTEAGTVLVKDFFPELPFAVLTPLGTNGVLFFSAASGLWKTDGTDAGTALIRDSILPDNRWLGCGGASAQVSDALVFAARDGNGCELWRSDGVTADLLLDINPGPASSLGPIFDSSSFRKVGGLALFSAYDDAHGLELWATNGTNTTRVVQDLAVGAGWSSPRFFTPVGPLVFFTANDHMNGNELWAISKSALHRALNLPEPSDDLAALDEPARRPHATVDEFRAFLPSAEEDDPGEPVASEGE